MDLLRTRVQFPPPPPNFKLFSRIFSVTLFYEHQNKQMGLTPSAAEAYFGKRRRLMGRRVFKVKE